jgi:hypothetical protein
MVASPALAAGGYQEVGRGITLAGARTHMRVDVRTLDNAPQSGTEIELALGATETGATFTVTFLQAAGSGVANRALRLDGFGDFAQVNGGGCTLDPPGGGFGQLTCNRPGYDWTMDRFYRVVLVRGAQTSAGWLWTVNVVDLKTGTVTKLVSLRSPLGSMSPNDNNATLYSNIANCAAIDRVAAAVRKPVASGSTVTWQSVMTFREGCPGSTLRAPLDSNGNLALVIAP